MAEMEVVWTCDCCGKTFPDWETARAHEVKREADALTEKILKSFRKALNTKLRRVKP